MTKLRIRHNGQRFLVIIKEGKIQVKRPGWVINWNASARERETIARLLVDILKDLWPQAIKHEVLVGQHGELA